jgi:hypothetical protein
MTTRLLLASLLYALSLGALAHQPSNAYLDLRLDGTRLEGQLSVGLRDLHAALGLDTDRDQQLSWGEVRSAQARIVAYAQERLRVRADGALCRWNVETLLIEDRVDARHAALALAGSCPGAPAELSLDYDLLFDLDPTHRGLVSLSAGGSTQAAVFSPGRATLDFTVGGSSRGRLFADYLREGVWHIWIGLDHILFLLALLLPAVLIRASGRWHPARGLAATAWPVLGVVTAFTLAHSITLSLAALELVRLPSRWVEAVIALSVALAALNNIWPLVSGRRWLLAFGFGLIHGFGFASVLGELGLPAQARVLGLFAFNVGVELGQIAIVLVAVPVAYALRTTAFYQRGVMPWGSALVALLAGWWCVERAVFGA